MAYDVPREHGERLKLLVNLQVKINVLRRAQVLAPAMAEELQAVIDDIEGQLRALER